MKKLFFLIITLLTFSLFSQEKTNSKLVYIVGFKNYKTASNSDYTNRISSSLETNLSNAGFQIKKVDSLPEGLKQAKQENASFLINGFYKKSENNNLNLYGQIYNPETGYVIDALNITDEISGAEGINLDPSEIQTNEEHSLQDFAKKITIRLRTNTKRTERRENISDFIENNPIGKEMDFPISKEDLSKASEDVFKLLSEKEDTIVSASKFAQKTSDAPASVTVINRDQIRRSGFRNIAEALNYLPDTYTHYIGNNFSVDFRGLYIGANSEKSVLYMQDGKKLNDYFFLGNFYSDTYTDMERIERIEVIKGPGAALYGNGAVMGTVNIVTRKPTRKNESELITEYDSVLKTSTLRGLYYSKFSEHFTVSLDVSGFKGQGNYNSGQDSWGSTRFYNPSTGTTTGTSQYGRQTVNTYTEQGYWGTTHSPTEKMRWFPNYNLDVTYKDFNFKSYYFSKSSSWLWPQQNLVYGSPNNYHFMGTGVNSIDYTPSYLKKQEASIKVFHQIMNEAINFDFDFQGWANSAASAPYTASGGVNSATNKIADPNFTTSLLAYGGNVQNKIRGTSRANGTEFQITPFNSKFSGLLESVRFMTGGNAQNVDYINYQGLVGADNIVYRYNQGVKANGKQFGAWSQLTLNFTTNTSLIAGLRYDYQKIERVYRYEAGNPNFMAYETALDSVSKSSLASPSFIPFTDPVINSTQSNYILQAGNYTQPLQRKDVVAHNSTPRMALVQNIPSLAMTVKLIYSEAFRMVTPQEVIRLPASLGNATSEKLYNREIVFINNFLKNRLTTSVNGFHINGSTIYAQQVTTLALTASPPWSNTGATFTALYLINNQWRISAGHTTYQLRRPNDNHLLGDIGINSPEKLWKAAISRSILDDKYSVSLEYYYNSEIYTTYSPPTSVSSVLKSNGTFYAPPPLPGETQNPFPGQNSVLRVWKVPPSSFFNFTFSSNIGNDLILVISSKNIFNQKVYSLIDVNSEAINTPSLPTHQLLGFGREVYFKLGYRF